MEILTRTETIDFNEFMAGTWREKRAERRAETLTAVGMSMLPLTVAFDTKTAHAGAIRERIASAFDPIIELAQGVSYPLTFLMITGGFILIIIGQKSRGLSMMKWAAVGFIGLQFAPVIMQILMGVGDAMKGTK